VLVMHHTLGAPGFTGKHYCRNSKTGAPRPAARANAGHRPSMMTTLHARKYPPAR
jgi:hypothetical protein